MTARFAVVAEAEADFRMASHLADRVCFEEAQAQEEWLGDHYPDIPDWLRVWQIGDGRSFLTWTEAKHVANQKGIRVHGHFSNESAASDAQAARKALLVVERLAAEPVDAIVLMRDHDGDGARVRGHQQARDWYLRCGKDERTSAPTVVIGIAITRREAWALAGFVPADSAETQRLEAARKTLGFCPITKSDCLTATGDAGHGKKNAK